MAYQHELQNATKGIAGHSYTQIWEEELGRRFHATSFVPPSEPDHTLKDGRLKVVRQLAFGGFSAIYLAQKEGNELVILKEAVVPPSSNEEAKLAAQEYLAKEAEILSGLSHPQIARVLDVFVEDARPLSLARICTRPGLASTGQATRRSERRKSPGLGQRPGRHFRLSARPAKTGHPPRFDSG